MIKDTGRVITGHGAPNVELITSIHYHLRGCPKLIFKDHSGRFLSFITIDPNLPGCCQHVEGIISTPPLDRCGRVPRGTGDLEGIVPRIEIDLQILRISGPIVVNDSLRSHPQP